MKVLKVSLTILILSVIPFASCTDNSLNEVPLDFLADENFWQSEEDALFAVRGIYGPLKNITWGWQILNLHQEYARGRGSWAPTTFWDEPFNPGRVEHSGRIWTNAYTIINRANNVLVNVPEIEFNESLKTSYLAEAYFMRAWAYDILMKSYGPVPLRLEPSTPGNLHAPREPVDLVYQQVISDAQIAEAGLPVSVGAATGRASVGAAKMLQASAHLYMGNWQLAAQKAEEVINMTSEYSLVEVNEPDDFYNIFATPANSEEIFALHFSQGVTDNMPNTYHAANTHRWNNSTSGFYTTLPIINENEPTIIAPENWDDGDLRQDFNLYSEYENAEGEIVPVTVAPVLFKKIIKDPSGQQTNSRPLFRYAEAFLIYAEAAAMAAGGPTAQALERLNIIKRRAHGHDLFSPSPADYPAGMSLAEFQNVIMRERAHEFMHEYKRWFDLKRWGKVEEAIMAATGLQIHPSRFWFPIPPDEINNNDEINQEDQNPGY